MLSSFEELHPYPGESRRIKFLSSDNVLEQPYYAEQIPHNIMRDKEDWTILSKDGSKHGAYSYDVVDSKDPGKLRFWHEYIFPKDGEKQKPLPNMNGKLTFTDLARKFIHLTNRYQDEADAGKQKFVPLYEVALIEIVKETELERFSIDGGKTTFESGGHELKLYIVFISEDLRTSFSAKTLERKAKVRQEQAAQRLQEKEEHRRLQKRKKRLLKQQQQQQKQITPSSNNNSNNNNNNNNNNDDSAELKRRKEMEEVERQIQEYVLRGKEQANVEKMIDEDQPISDVGNLVLNTRAYEPQFFPRQLSLIISGALEALYEFYRYFAEEDEELHQIIPHYDLDAGTAFFKVLETGNILLRLSPRTLSGVLYTSTKQSDETKSSKTYPKVENDLHAMSQFIRDSCYKEGLGREEAFRYFVLFEVAVSVLFPQAGCLDSNDDPEKRAASNREILNRVRYVQQKVPNITFDDLRIYSAILKQRLLAAPQTPELCMRAGVPFEDQGFYAQPKKAPEKSYEQLELERRQLEEKRKKEREEAERATRLEPADIERMASFGIARYQRHQSHMSHSSTRDFIQSAPEFRTDANDQKRVNPFESGGRAFKRANSVEAMCKTHKAASLMGAEMHLVRCFSKVASVMSQRSASAASDQDMTTLFPRQNSSYQQQHSAKEVSDALQDVVSAICTVGTQGGSRAGAQAISNNPQFQAVLTGVMEMQRSVSAAASESDWASGGGMQWERSAEAAASGGGGGLAMMNLFGGGERQRSMDALSDSGMCTANVFGGGGGRQLSAEAASNSGMFNARSDEAAECANPFGNINFGGGGGALAAASSSSSYSNNNTMSVPQQVMAVARLWCASFLKSMRDRDADQDEKDRVAEMYFCGVLDEEEEEDDDGCEDDDGPLDDHEPVDVPVADKITVVDSNFDEVFNSHPVLICSKDKEHVEEKLSDCRSNALKDRRKSLVDGSLSMAFRSSSDSVTLMAHTQSSFAQEDESSSSNFFETVPSGSLHNNNNNKNGNNNDEERAFNTNNQNDDDTSSSFSSSSSPIVLYEKCGADCSYRDFALRLEKFFVGLYFPPVAELGESYPLGGNKPPLPIRILCDRFSNRFFAHKEFVNIWRRENESFVMTHLIQLAKQDTTQKMRQASKVDPKVVASTVFGDYDRYSTGGNFVELPSVGIEHELYILNRDQIDVSPVMKNNRDPGFAATPVESSPKNAGNRSFTNNSSVISTGSNEVVNRRDTVSPVASDNDDNDAEEKDQKNENQEQQEQQPQPELPDIQVIAGDPEAQRNLASASYRPQFTTSGGDLLFNQQTTSSQLNVLQSNRTASGLGGGGGRELSYNASTPSMSLNPTVSMSAGSGETSSVVHHGEDSSVFQQVPSEVIATAAPSPMSVTGKKQQQHHQDPTADSVQQNESPNQQIISNNNTNSNNNDDDDDTQSETVNNNSITMTARVESEELVHQNSSFGELRQTLGGMDNRGDGDRGEYQYDEDELAEEDAENAATNNGEDTQQEQQSEEMTEAQKRYLAELEEQRRKLDEMNMTKDIIPDLRKSAEKIVLSEWESINNNNDSKEVNDLIKVDFHSVLLDEDAPRAAALVATTSCKTDSCDGRLMKGVFRCTPSSPASPNVRQQQQQVSQDIPSENSANQSPDQKQASSSTSVSSSQHASSSAAISQGTIAAANTSTTTEPSKTTAAAVGAESEESSLVASPVTPGPQRFELRSRFSGLAAQEVIGRSAIIMPIVRGFQLLHCDPCQLQMMIPELRFMQFKGIILQMLLQLDYLHRIAGVIHADIKRNNYHAGANTWFDFGYSIVVPRDQLENIYDPDKLKLPDDQYVEFPQYRLRAPEINCADRKKFKVSAKLDIFAFGLMMMQFLIPKYWGYEKALRHNFFVTIEKNQCCYSTEQHEYETKEIPKEIIDRFEKQQRKVRFRDVGIIATTTSVEAKNSNPPIDKKHPVTMAVYIHTKEEDKNLEKEVDAMMRELPETTPQEVTERGDGSCAAAVNADGNEDDLINNCESSKNSFASSPTALHHHENKMNSDRSLQSGSGGGGGSLLGSRLNTSNIHSYRTNAYSQRGDKTQQNTGGDNNNNNNNGSSMLAHDDDELHEMKYDQRFFASPIDERSGTIYPPFILIRPLDTKKDGIFEELLLQTIVKARSVLFNSKQEIRDTLRIIRKCLDHDYKTRATALELIDDPFFDDVKKFPFFSKM